MDPDANLIELLTLAAFLLAELDSDTPTEPLHLVDAGRAAELIQSLDGWLSTGGFLPQRWALGRADTLNPPTRVHPGAGYRSPSPRQSH